MNDLTGSPIDLDAITIENRVGSGDIYIGGHNRSDRDAFVGRFRFVNGSSSYEPSSNALGANFSAPTATLSDNRVLDLEYFHQTSKLFSTGQFNQTNPIGSGFTVTGPSDAFVLIYDPIDFSLPPIGSSAGTVGDGSGIAIDVGFVSQPGTIYAVGVTGAAEGSLTNWGPTTNTINNSFITLLHYDIGTVPATLNHQWTNVLDYTGSIQEAFGTGVVFSEQYLNATGIFDGSSFDIFGGGCSQPGSAGFNSGYLASFDKTMGTCFQSGTTQSFFTNHNAVDIAYDFNRLFVTGNYQHDVTMHTATIPPSVIHPNPGITENYVVRYDLLGSNYFKHGEVLGDSDLLPEDIMTVAPNPSSGVFQLNLNELDVISISVVDISGSVVYEAFLNEGTTNIDLTSLPKGI
jgi:hypothetical protein